MHGRQGVSLQSLVAKAQNNQIQRTAGKRKLLPIKDIDNDNGQIEAYLVYY